MYTTWPHMAPRGTRGEWRSPLHDRVVPAAEAFAEPLPLQELGANNAPMAAATAPAVAASGAG